VVKEELALEVRGSDEGAILRLGIKPPRRSNPPPRLMLRYSGSPGRASLSSGETEGSFLVKTSRELVVLHGTSYFGVRQVPGVPAASSSSE
jgi:hypothetical protein